MSFEEFQAAVGESGLEVAAAELKRSYNGLTSLKKRKKLAAAAIRGKVVNLRKDLEVIRSDPELFGNAPKKLKAARIPLTAQGLGTLLVWCLTDTLTNLRVLLAVGCVALPRVVHATRAGLKPAPTSHRALPTTKMPSHLHNRICETPH